MTLRKPMIDGKWECARCKGSFLPSEMMLPVKPHRKPSYCKPCKSYLSATAGRVKRRTYSVKSRRVLTESVALWCCFLLKRKQFNQVKFKADHRTFDQICAGGTYKELRMAEVTDINNIPASLINYWFDLLYPEEKVRHLEILELLLQQDFVAHTVKYFQSEIEKYRRRLDRFPASLEAKRSIILAPPEKKLKEADLPKRVIKPFNPATDIVTDPVLSVFNSIVPQKVNAHNE